MIPKKLTLKSILEKSTAGFTQVPITSSSLEKIKVYAQLAERNELYGFLVAPSTSRDGVVTDALLAYGQKVSGAAGHLDERMAAYAKAEIENKGYVAIGFWHSHGGFGVFHSGTDDHNMDHLVGSLASNSEEKLSKDRPKRKETAQTLTFRSVDQEAVVRLKDWYGGLSIKAMPSDVAMPVIEGASPVAVLYEHQVDNDLLMWIAQDRVRSTQIPLIAKKKPSEYLALGVAYSIVTNMRGDIYAELATNTWCSHCEHEEMQIRKDVTLRPIDGESPAWTMEGLKEEIAQRVSSSDLPDMEDEVESGGLKNKISSKLRSLLYGR